MKANIATLRSELSQILERIQQGETCDVQKRNVTIARLVPVRVPASNKTKLGVGKGTVIIVGDIVEPVMENDWEMNERVTE